MAVTDPGTDPGARARRVVVTGLGVVSALGTGVRPFAAAIRAGVNGARPLTAFDTEGFAHVNGCEVVDFDAGRHIRTIPVAELGRASRFAVAAARMACEDAGLDVAELADRRGLVSVGTTDGGAYELDTLVEDELAGGPESLDPVRVRSALPARLSTSIARELGLTRTEAVTVGTACAAGNYSIGYGLDAVRSGEAEFALCGGADSVCRKTFVGFSRLGTIASDVCRPFDTDREGILTGEGAGVVLLEPLDSALERGARIYAEVLGFGLNCDGLHPIAPDEDSVAACISLALADAGVKPAEVDLVSAHGTGTRANDICESAAIRQVYGDRPPPTISVKSMLGHAMGAASALGFIACALAIRDRFVPPTINHRETDPECGIDCVPNHAVPADLRVVQNNGLAFGGNNAVVVLGRLDEEDS